MENEILKGQEIRDKFFDGNPYKELKQNRQLNNANVVISDLLRSLLDSNYERMFTDDDVAAADEIIKDSIKLNNDINDFLKQ